MKGSVSTLATLLISLMLITTLVTSYLLLHEASIKELKHVELRGVEKVREASKDVDVSLDDGFLRIATSQPPLKVLVALAVYSNGNYRELARDELLNPSNYVISEDELRSILDSGGKVFIVLSNGDYILIDDKLLDSLEECGSDGPEILHYLLRPYIILGEVYNASSYLENPIPGNDPNLSNYKPLLLSYLTNETNAAFTYFTLKYIGNSYIRVNIHGDITASLMVTIPMLIHRDDDVYKRVLFHVVLRPTYCILYNYDVIMNLRTKIYVVPVIDYLRSPLVTELSDVMIGNQLGSSIAKSLYTEELQFSQLRATAQANPCKLMSDEDIFIIEFNSTRMFEYIPKELDEVVALLTLQASIYRTPPDVVNYSIIDISLFDISEVYYIDITNESLINKPLLLLSKLPGITARVLSQDSTALITYTPQNVELRNYRSITWVNISKIGKYSLSIIKGSSSNEADLPPPSITTQYKVEIKSISSEVRTIRVSDYSLSKYVIDPNNITYVHTYVFTHTFSGRVQGSGWRPIRTVGVVYSSVPSIALYTLTVSSGNCPQTYIDWRPVTSSLRTYAYYEWYGQCHRDVKVSVTYNSENEELSLAASLTSYGEDYLRFDLTLMINETITLNPSDESVLKVYVGNDGDVKLLAIDLDELVKPIIK